MTLIKLLWIFFQIGLFTIGGGQVAITLMRSEERRVGKEC